MADKQKTKTTKGTTLPKNTAAALCYLAGWVTGLIFITIEKKDKFVRFHAMQSIVTFGALTILTFTPFAPLAMLASFILWLVLIIKAYQGEKFKVPVLGDFAEKQLNK